MKQIPLYRMAWNYANAVAKRFLFGGDVLDEEYKKRLEICSDCSSRDGERCSECGCPIVDKAMWNTERCPLKKW